MTATIFEKTIRGLIAAAIFFLVALLANAYSSYRLADLSRLSFHTHGVIEELKDSLSALQDVETGERGYVVNGKENYLEPYNWGRVNKQKHLDNVRHLLADEPDQQADLAKLEQLADEKLALSAKSVEGRRAGDGSALFEALQPKGKAVMDQYRQVIARMSEHEINVLNNRNDQLRGIQMQSALATAALTVFSFGLLGWVFTITQRTINEEKVRVAVLNGLNQGLNREIDERKKAEESLKEASAKLISSNTDLQQFAYVASHDLQEPLRAVAGFLSLLSKKHADGFDDESKQWITHSVEGAQRMRSLINDLLSYARLETRGKAFEQIDIKKVVHQAEIDLNVAIEEADAEIIVGDLPVVKGDNSQLSQLFQNLLGNAVKFRGPNKPNISINAEQKNEIWQFAVRDNGIGFDMEHAARIFVIFQRLQGREEYRGTGIGLALCKKIVERHGGTIWAESEVGKGSTFYFTIPTLHGENNGFKTD